MKNFSRHMPKSAARGELTATGWIFLMFLAGLLVYTIFELLFHPTWFTLAVAIIVLYIAVAIHMDIRKRNRLREARAGHSICTFARALPMRELDPWVVRATYEELGRSLGSEKDPFPVLPSDRLQKDYTMDEEDFEDILYDILQRAGRSLENIENNPMLQKVVTVEDLIRAIQWQAKSDETAAA